MTRTPLTARAVRGAAAALAALALVAGATGCSSEDAEAAGQGTLRVGQLGSAEVTKKLLEVSGEDDTGYTVEYSLFPAGPSLLEAVDSLDVGMMADTPSIFAQAGNIPIRAVSVGAGLAEGESTVNIFASKESGLTSVADLKGRKVATTEATILQYTLVKALEKAGLEYSDVEVVNLPPADALAAFNAGDVDAVTALDPQLSQLAAAGAVKIGDGVGLTSGHSYISATDKALADEEVTADIEDFVARYQRAEAWADAHPTEWAAAYSEVTGLDLPTAEAIVAREKYTPVAIDEQVIAQQQDQADAYLALGLLKSRLDVSAEFDDRFNHLVEGK